MAEYVEGCEHWCLPSYIGQNNNSQNRDQLLHGFSVSSILSLALLNIHFLLKFTTAHNVPTKSQFICSRNFTWWDPFVMINTMIHLNSYLRL